MSRTMATRTTVHWHGLRLENRYDGTHETQPPIPVGDRFSVQATFPDPGVYWYHPHIREDYGQEMGLYGTSSWSRATRVLAPGRTATCSSRSTTSFSRRAGRAVQPRRDDATRPWVGSAIVLLVGGETEHVTTAQLGEVVRLYLTNTANTRVFKVAMPGARMKLVGGDSGHVEHEQFVEDVVLAPSERAVVDVLFDRPGELTLEHHTPERVYPLATIQVSGIAPSRRLSGSSRFCGPTPTWWPSVSGLAPYFWTPSPTRLLAFIAEMDMGAPEGEGRSSTPARCIPRSSGTSPATARSAA